MKFTDLVVVVMFVEGARLDLRTMIARHKLLNLKGRRNSYRQRLLRYEYETGERRALERTRGCSNPLQTQGTVSSRRDGGGCVAVRDGERTCPRLERKEIF